MKSMSLSRFHLRRVLVGCGVAAGFLLVTASIDPDWTRADTGRSDTPTQAHTALPGVVLGTLETRTRVITIRATSDGPRYDVRDRADGAPLAVNLTAEEVSASFPDLPLEGVDIAPRMPGDPLLIMLAPTSDLP